MTTKRVLVTGSSRGIGAATASALADDGYHVVLHCRSQIDQAGVIREQIHKKNGSVSIVQFDVTDRAQARETIEEDIETNGAYYGVVCNAGIARDNAFPAMPEVDWDAVVHTNLDAFYNVLHPAVMPMVRRRKPGRIVTLSSVAGIMGNRGQTNYSAAKSGIIGATKALATELAIKKITVNCVAPGLVSTDMTSDVPMEEALKQIPMGRAGEPSEVAGLVRFLMSDQASYITRQVISVNGGMF